MRTAVEEACWLAVNLARNCNFAVFPCKQDKTPATPHGFKDATRHPEKVPDLWGRHPGRLIGIATGAVSGISVLDLDAKHDAACAWWTQHAHLIPVTRRFRTRSGGIHIYFRHCPGIGNKQGKIVPGVDTRGDGAYVIHWFSAGLPCLDQSPPVQWPSWLVGLVNRPKPPAPRRDRPRRRGNDDATVDGLTRIVRDAAEGERNAKLFWAANRIRERDATRNAAEAILVPAAREAGLPDFEARRTIASAWRGA